MEKRIGLIFGAIFVLAILSFSLGSVSAATPATNANHNNFFNQFTNLWNKLTGQVISPEGPIKKINLTYNLTEGPVSSNLTRRIAYWWGKVNLHLENGKWVTDPDGVSGANLDKLEYCQKWYPNTISVKPYKIETITGWRNRGNVDGPFTSKKQTYECIQGNAAECVDSDGGLDYYVKGRITSGYDSYTNTSISSNDRIEDVCAWQNNAAFSPASPVLMEQYCANSTTRFTKLYSCPFGCYDGACLNSNETKPLNSSCSNGACLIFGSDYATFNNSNSSGVFAVQVSDSDTSIQYYHDNKSEFTSWISTGETYKFNNSLKVQVKNIVSAQSVGEHSFVIFNYSLPFQNISQSKSYCTPSGNCTLYKGDSIIYPYSFEGQKEALNFSIDTVSGIWSQDGKENVELDYTPEGDGTILVTGQHYRMGDQLITMVDVPLNGPINFQVSPITNSANCTFLNQTVVSGEKYMKFSCSLGGYLGNEIYINSLNVSSRAVGSVVFHMYGNMIDVKSFPQKFNDLWLLPQNGSIKVLGFTPGQESSDGSEKIILEVMGVHIPTTTQKEYFSNSENTTFSENTTPSCNGCSLGGKCYDLGYRINDTYCSTNGFVNQSTQDSVCQNNFECTSNLCINSKCVSGSVWNKLLDWFQKLFG